MVPATGSALRKYDGGGYEMYVEWTLNGAGAYGTANAPLNNQDLAALVLLQTRGVFTRL